MKMVLCLLCGFFTFSPCDSLASEKVFGEVSASRHGRYPNTINRWAEADKGKVFATDFILAIGSSSMGGWRTIQQDLAPAKIIHRGFGGSKMSDVLAHKAFFREYGVSRIMIYEGDNDLMSDRKTPEGFVKNCKDFATYIWEKYPKTEVYFISVKPSIGRWGKWDKFKAANKLLEQYTKSDKRLYYMDVATPMLNKAGTVRKETMSHDNVHMTRAGYKIWASVIRPYFIK